jgi:hypothetical protein
MGTWKSRDRMTCCGAPTFGLLEDLGHVEAVDWDLGRCTSCGSYLLQQWSEHAPLNVFLDKLSDEEGERFARSRGRERLMLLKRWYADH